MVLAAAALLLVAVLAAAMVRFLLAWFNKMNLDSLTGLAEPYLEDPNSAKPVPVPSVFSEPSKTLSVVIPAYNEEGRLPGTLTELMAYLQKRRNRQGPLFTYEVVVVDDGSKDSTVGTAFNFVRQHGLDAIRVLRLPSNRGKGAAVKAGCLAARGQRVLFMDADGATKVSDMEALEAKLQEITAPKPTNGAAAAAAGGAASASGSTTSMARSDALGFVLGSRAHLQDAATAKRSPLRNFLMHGFHFLVTMVVGARIRDTQCGFKLMTRRAAQQLCSNQRLQRWCFDVELVYLAEQLQVPMAEVQVHWTEVPGSKIRPTSMVHMALELCAIRAGYGLGLWRVRGEEELGKRQ